jgi:6-phosphogluconolactonase (cycloisomerase 2 family)
MNSRLAVASLSAALLAACGMAADSPSRSAASAETPAPALLRGHRTGAVFTLTDDPAGNAVLAFARSSDGTLQPAGSYPTGGKGAGGGLGSQGALVLSQDGRLLVAVNAGSDEVSSFRVDGTLLTLAGRAPSGGSRPVSVAEHHGLVYVVNAGGAGSVSGLLLGEEGALHPLPGSTRPLSASGAAPAQISFDPSGETLAVSEKATRTISLYRVGEDGRAAGPHPAPSSGETPFGFAFTRRGVLVVSEAFGGRAGASAVSSYQLEEATLEVVSPSVPDLGTAACWVAVSRDGRHAFVTNTGSDNLSSYRIDGKGRLTLLASSAASVQPHGRPVDMAFGGSDRFLYTLDAGTLAIEAFAVGSDGGLHSLGPQATGLPAHVVGLAAR